MKIIEGITATGDHVWIVIESAEIETGFRTEAQANSYRSALLAYKTNGDRRLLRSVERLRRSATITYTAGTKPMASLARAAKAGQAAAQKRM